MARVPFPVFHFLLLGIVSHSSVLQLVIVGGHYRKKAFRYAAHGCRAGNGQLTGAASEPTLVRVNLDRAQESLAAAQLCLRHDLVNSATSRAYYAMFQAAQVALKRAKVGHGEWNHPAMQAAFATELVGRRKIYPSMFRSYLTTGLRARQVADYGIGVSKKTTERLIRKAAAFVAAITKEAQS